MKMMGVHMPIYQPPHMVWDGVDTELIKDWQTRIKQLNKKSEIGDGLT